MILKHWFFFVLKTKFIIAYLMFIYNIYFMIYFTKIVLYKTNYIYFKNYNEKYIF
jgi:hypothetical protein